MRLKLHEEENEKKSEGGEKTKKAVPILTPSSE
jgi:hypothetical protein